jgi:dipeptidyl aminopeptidase/acylaminoacyl peptidase
VRMRNYARAALLLLAVVPAAAQEPVVQVPSNITVEGMPPIPESIPKALAPYASARSTVALAWHPTKRQIVVANDSGAVVQAYSVDGPGAPRTQLTSFTDAGRVDSAVFDPASGASFIVRKDAGSSVSNLYRVDAASGQTTVLTDGKSRNFTPVWSRTTGLVAFTSTKRNGADRDVYLMDPKDPSSVRLLCENQGTWFLAAWSPDDSELLAWQSLSNQESYIWRINARTGEKTPITSRTTNAEVWTPWQTVPQYAPDGKSIYAGSNRESEFYRMWKVEVATGAGKPLTADGDQIEAFALSPNGATLAVVFDRDGASVLELLDARSGKVKSRPLLPTGQLALGSGLRWRPDGSELAISMWSKRSFGDVYTVNTKTASVARWTASESAGFDFDTLPDPEIIRWKSFDGTTVTGVMNRPPAKFKGRRPVIINIHGGPNSKERPRFQGRSAYFLNELGIAIVYPNVRGSAGFNRTFSAMDNRERREGAVKDIGALLDWIAKQPNLDKSRVMVTGVSYGGYMTYAVAAAYSDRIRCAYAAAGISNFVTYLEKTEPSRIADRRVEYGDERDPKMREFLTRISPVTSAANIRVPLLIAHGRKDSFVPVDQALDISRIVKANKVPVWTMIFEDEGHEGWGRATGDFHFNAWVHFAQQFLLNADVKARGTTAAGSRR